MRGQTGVNIGIENPPSVFLVKERAIPAELRSRLLEWRRERGREHRPHPQRPTVSSVLGEPRLERGIDFPIAPMEL